MSRNGFKGERTVEFKYLKKGTLWRLVNKSVDPEVKRVVGSKALQMPRVIHSQFIPSEFLLRLYAALAEHHLEAGKIGAFYGSHEDTKDSMDSYRVEITIRRQRIRPGE